MTVASPVTISLVLQSASVRQLASELYPADCATSLTEQRRKKRKRARHYRRRSTSLPTPDAEWSTDAEDPIDVGILPRGSPEAEPIARKVGRKHMLVPPEIGTVWSCCCGACSYRAASEAALTPGQAVSHCLCPWSLACCLPGQAATPEAKASGKAQGECQSYKSAVPRCRHWRSTEAGAEPALSAMGKQWQR